MVVPPHGLHSTQTRVSMKGGCNSKSVESLEDGGR